MENNMSHTTTNRPEVPNENQLKNKGNLRSLALLIYAILPTIACCYILYDYYTSFNTNDLIAGWLKYLWGFVLGSFLVFIKEKILPLALDDTKDISICKSLLIIFFFPAACAVVWYFTVDTAQKYVDPLTLVVTIFIQNEITAKLWR